jgi:tetratricopeptide (TPR) repeat protein
MLGTSRVVAAMLTSALLVAQVAAQPGPPPTPAQKQQVQDLVKQAIAKSQAGDHAAAIELYQKAYATTPLPTLLSNIGAEYQLATKPVEALKYFCMYLEKDPAGPLASYATGQAKLLQSQLTGAPVEEANVCKAPVTAPPPPPPDKHEPVVVAPSGPADPGKGLKTTGLVVGGVGVLSLGLGIYFGIQAKKISDDITENGEMWRNDIIAYQDKGQRDEYLQITFLIVGAAAVTGGALLYMKGRNKTKASESMTVTPSMGPGGSAGLTLSGAF